MSSLDKVRNAVAQFDGDSDWLRLCFKAIADIGLFPMMICGTVRFGDQEVEHAWLSVIHHGIRIDFGLRAKLGPNAPHGVFMKGSHPECAYLAQRGVAQVKVSSDTYRGAARSA